MAKHSVAGRMVGLFSACFCSKAAVFIVSNMLRLLFEAVPSVPRHILAPLFFSMLCLKVFPTQSFMLAIGLCTTLTPFFAIMPASFFLDAVFYFLLCLGDMDMHPYILFFREFRCPS